MSDGTTRPLVLLYGGTFDPVHNGHLALLWQVYLQLQPQRVSWVPCAIPPHKAEPHASGEQRLKMLQLVTEELNRASPTEVFAVEELELAREQISYTIDTLASLRQRWGAETAIVWLIGMDSWLHLYQWHRWQELTDFAHLAVVGRPGYNSELDSAQQAWATPKVGGLDAVRHAAAGRIVFLETPLLAIASAQIRQHLAMGLRPLGLVPSLVEEYIHQRGFYLPTQRQTT